MKTLFSLGAIVAFLGLAVASTFAQTQSTTSTSTTYVQTSKIVGTKVKSSQGEEIGVIKDVVLDRNTGCMAYTVLSTGGGARARGGKMVAVPWAVYSPTSNVGEFTVTVDRERIYSAPVFDYARIDEYSRPDYITSVYSYYGVSPGAAVGVGVSGSTTTTGATTSTGTTTTTGAAATAAATSSPGETASPGATASPAATAPPARQRVPGATATPAGGASPSPHATAGATSPHATPVTTPRTRGGRPQETASPSTRGEATGTSPTEERRGTRGRYEQTTPSTGRSETGREETGSRSETERAPSEVSSPTERTTGSQRRERGKRETTSPSEEPPGEE